MLADSTDACPAPWMDAGACRGEDPELFFPLSTRNGQAEAALSVCHGCDVEAECLRWALRLRVQHGIWGGHTEQQRGRMLRAALRGRADPPSSDH